MDYQKLIVAGNITGDAQARVSKQGDVGFTTFSVAVSSGKDQPTYFPVTAFGKTGEAAAQYLKKGQQVLVDGRIEVAENGRFNVVATRVVFGATPAARRSEPEEA
jgi:single-stranded DNA-binding protein